MGTVYKGGFGGGQVASSLDMSRTLDTFNVWTDWDQALDYFPTDQSMRQPSLADLSVIRESFLDSADVYTILCWLNDRFRLGDLRQLMRYSKCYARRLPAVRVVAPLSYAVIGGGTQWQFPYLETNGTLRSMSVYPLDTGYFDGFGFLVSPHVG